MFGVLGSWGWTMQLAMLPLWSLRSTTTNDAAIQRWLLVFMNPLASMGSEGWLVVSYHDLLGYPDVKERKAANGVFSV